MTRTLIILPDGTEVFSGASEKNAIQSKTITKMVNDGTELSVGSVCSFVFQAKIITPDGGLTISEGSDIEVYEVDDLGDRNKVGIFRVEKPTRPTANTYQITAYDHTVKLDKDLTEWFNTLNSWPYTLYEFASIICAECGLVLKNESIPNGNRLIQKFKASGITGRQLMKYVGQACCRFGRMTVDGDIEFAWYATSEKKVTISDFYQNGLSYEDYVTYPIERVQLRQTEADIGTIYPESNGTNTYVIEGNPLLVAESETDLLEVAETIYSELRGVFYTPCKCSLFYPSGVDVGDIISITDRNGVEITAYVMKSIVRGRKQTIECFGSYRRDSVSLKNNESLIEPLYGKMLEMEASIEGALVRVSDLQTEVGENAEETGRQIAEISVKSDSVSAAVSQQAQNLEGIRTEMASLVATSGQISVQVQSIIEDGVSKVKTGMGYTLDDKGLSISKEGDEIENLINNRGVYVGRGDEEMLRADANGVKATDMTVRNYLIIPNTRFEAFDDGIDGNCTAAFSIA